MMSLTENEFKILKSILDRDDKKKGLIVINGTSVDEIACKTGLSSKKIRDTLNKFKKMGYVNEGFKRVRLKTYILTKEGVLFLNNIRKNTLGGELINE